MAKREQHEWEIMSRMVVTRDGIGRVFSAPIPIGEKKVFKIEPKAERVGVQFDNGKLQWYGRWDVMVVSRSA